MSEVISDEITFTEGMSDEEAQGILAIDLADAIDFCDNVISPARA